MQKSFQSSQERKSLQLHSVYTIQTASTTNQNSIHWNEMKLEAFSSSVWNLRQFCYLNSRFSSPSSSFSYFSREKKDMKFFNRDFDFVLCRINESSVYLKLRLRCFQLRQKQAAATVAVLILFTFIVLIWLIKLSSLFLWVLFQKRKHLSQYSFCCYILLAHIKYVSFLPDYVSSVVGIW